MIPEIQILVLLLVVIAAVAVVAARLEIPAAILLVLDRRRPGARSGAADREAGAGIRIAVRPAADHLFLGGGDELARVPLQSAAHFAAGRRLRACSPPSRSRR